MPTAKNSARISFPSHLYSEHNPYRAAVLRERIEDGLLPKGVVDERDIEVIPDEDFLGYTQIHLFAGIGGFPLGLRLAGFPEDRRIITGGFPCQDISNAGKCAGITGSRSRLWREMVRCVRVVRPELVFVENVAALLGRGMGVVLGDLAEIGYDANGDCVSAADVGAPHLRRRIWIVAYSNGGGLSESGVFEELARRTETVGTGEISDARSCGRDEREFNAHAGQSYVAWCGEVSDAQSLRGTSFVGNESNGDVPNVLADAAETRCDGRTRKEQSLCRQSSLPARSGGCSEVADTAQRGFAVRGEPSELGRLTECSSETLADSQSNEERWTREEPREQQIKAGRRSSQSAEIPDSECERLEGIDAAGTETWSVNRSSDGCHRTRWPVEPNVGRVAHGIPKRVDRLAALGDAIVPQCVQEVVSRVFQKG